LKAFLFILFVGLIVAVYVGNLYYKNFLISNVNTNGKEQFIFIPKKANQEDVIKLLQGQEILIDYNSIKWLAEIKNYKGNNIVAGKYKIEDGLTNNQLINHLRAGNGRLPEKVTFSLVRNLKQLAGAMTKNISLDSAEFYQYLISPESFQNYGFNKNTFISMFIPNTYFVDWDVSAPRLVKKMAQEYKKFWDNERKSKLAKTGLSQTDAITMASIIYWETKNEDDKRTIAGLYLNRIKRGIPLQADPTLIFAIGDYTIKRVLNVHKEVDSPYNTYKHKGLPPGPILIPPISYIDAVLDHEKHNFLYFVAKEDFSGRSYFSESYTQHLRYAKRYQQALNKRKIYR